MFVCVSEVEKKNMLGEITISGFRMVVYRSIFDYNGYLRISNAEFTTVKEVLDVLLLPPTMKTKLHQAMMTHLPVAEMKIRGQKVLLDCEQLRSHPQLLVKVMVLQKVPPARVLRKVPVHKGNKKTMTKFKGRKYFDKYPDVLEITKTLVESGMADHGGIEAEVFADI